MSGDGGREWSRGWQKTAAVLSNTHSHADTDTHTHTVTHTPLVYGWRGVAKTKRQTEGKTDRALPHEAEVKHSSAFSPAVFL